MEQVYHARLMRHRERLNTTGCPSVCLLVFRQSVCRQNAKKRDFLKKLSSLQLLTTYEVVHVLFKEPITGPLKSELVEIRHLENHDVIL